MSDPPSSLSRIRMGKERRQKDYQQQWQDDRRPPGSNLLVWSRESDQKSPWRPEPRLAWSNIQQSVKGWPHHINPAGVDKEEQRGLGQRQTESLDRWNTETEGGGLDQPAPINKTSEKTENPQQSKYIIALYSNNCLSFFSHQPMTTNKDRLKIIFALWHISCCYIWELVLTVCSSSSTFPFMVVRIT